MSNTCWVIMIEAGEAENWEQHPIAVFDDKEEARSRTHEWNRTAEAFQKMFDAFPYCGIDISWIEHMKFSLHEAAIPKKGKA